MWASHVFFMDAPNSTYRGRKILPQRHDFRCIVHQSAFSVEQRCCVHGGGRSGARKSPRSAWEARMVAYCRRVVSVLPRATCKYNQGTEQTCMLSKCKLYTCNRPQHQRSLKNGFPNLCCYRTVNLTQVRLGCPFLGCCGPLLFVRFFFCGSIFLVLSLATFGFSKAWSGIWVNFRIC